MSNYMSNIKIGNETYNVKDTEARAEITNLKQENINQNAKINSLSSGNPLVASSIEGMIDTNRIYVNTTDGKWYYHNGTEWVIGGTYQATGIEENSVGYEKLTFNVADEIKTFHNISADSVNPITNEGYTVYKYYIKANSIIKIKTYGNDTAKYCIQLMDNEEQILETEYFTSNGTIHSKKLYASEDIIIKVCCIDSEIPVVSIGIVDKKLEKENALIDLILNDENVEITKISITQPFEDTSYNNHHIGTKISFDISEFENIETLEIKYDILLSNVYLNRFLTRYRTQNGTLLESEFNKLNLEKNKFNKISIQGTNYTKTSNTFELFIMPMIYSSFVNKSAEYYLKNITLKINGIIIPVSNIENFQCTGTIKSNLIITKENISKYTHISNVLEGKTLLVIGDSISDDNANYCGKHYYEHLKEKDGLNYIMDGRMGTGYTVGYLNYLDIPSRIDNYSNYNPDFISIFAGTNDWLNAPANNKTLGSKGDTTSDTFYGCLKITFDKLINKYPLAKVLIATPIRRNVGNTNENGETLEQYCNAIKEMAHEYSFTTIDLYNEGGVNPQIEISRNTYFADNTHLNDKGQSRLYPKFKEGLLKA